MILNVPTLQGLTMNGVLKGTRVKESAPNQQGQTKKTVYVGLEVTKLDDYGQETSDTLECIISDKLLQSTSVLQKMLPLVGTEISLPVWGRVWATERSNGVQYYLANEVTELFK